MSVAFLACIFANIKTLQYCNVETFIVFRASTPVVIGAAPPTAPLPPHLHERTRPAPLSPLTPPLVAGVADWLFLGRELPNMRSRCRTGLTASTAPTALAARTASTSPAAPQSPLRPPSGSQTPHGSPQGCRLCAESAESFEAWQLP